LDFPGAPLRDATVFMVDCIDYADGSSAVCTGTAEALAEVAQSLSPVDLRRLIAVRNWRPESERGDLDAIIQTASAAGVA
jgi:hypothetical protein